MTTGFIEQSGMRSILPGFEIDDFVFDPLGYSINALRGSKYFTFHVTPQSHGSYVSFETNAIDESDWMACVSKVIAIFKPNTFDIITFNMSNNSETKRCDQEFNGYQLRRHVNHKLNSGYLVTFCHFFEPIKNIETAYEITGSHS